MTREQQILSLQPTVDFFVRRLHKTLPVSVVKDDLVGHAWIGAIKAVDMYKASSGTLLKTYAGIKIHGAMLDYLRSIDVYSRQERMALKASGDTPIRQVCSIDSEEVILRCRQRPIDEMIDESRIVARGLGRLNRQQYKAVKMYYYDEMVMKKIGRKLKVSESRIHQILKAAVKQMAIA